jgi:hypothetical protein
MNLYVLASKRVGWKEPVPPIHFPDLRKVMILGIRIEGSDFNDRWAAFVELFRIYRFAPSPMDEREVVTMNLVVAAHKRGREIFERQEAPS